MLLREALKAAIDRLTAAQVGSPRLNAEVLLMFALGKDRAYLYAHSDDELDQEVFARYDDALTQRAQGIPSQYITGHQEFWGLDFIVTPAVLIPRPETEHLIETALPLARAVNHPRIVDVGTGSGCIAIVLAKELPGAEIEAVDISNDALEIARANAARHQVNVQFRQNDLLTRFPANSFDMVVSNPPYVGDSEEEQVQLEVRKFEPRNAVFAGSTGIEIIERLIPQAEDKLHSGGRLVMEISGSIVEAVKPLLEGWDEVEIVPDLQSIPRIISAKKPKREGWVRLR
jgi:release factor glutamine methyltransferase